MNRILMAVAFLLVPAACARNSESAPARMQVSGTWLLNEKESQNPLVLIGGSGSWFGTGGSPRGEGPPIAVPPDGRAGGRAGTSTPNTTRARVDQQRAKINAVQQKLELFTDMHRKMTIRDNGIRSTWTTRSDRSCATSRASLQPTASPSSA